MEKPFSEFAFIFRKRPPVFRICRAANGRHRKTLDIEFMMKQEKVFRRIDRYSRCARMVMFVGIGNIPRPVHIAQENNANGFSSFPSEIQFAHFQKFGSDSSSPVGAFDQDCGQVTGFGQIGDIRF